MNRLLFRTTLYLSVTLLACLNTISRPFSWWQKISRAFQPSLRINSDNVATLEQALEHAFRATTSINTLLKEFDGLIKGFDNPIQFDTIAFRESLYPMINKYPWRLDLIKIRSGGYFAFEFKIYYAPRQYQEVGRLFMRPDAPHRPVRLHLDAKFLPDNAETLERLNNLDKNLKAPI